MNYTVVYQVEGIFYGIMFKAKTELEATSKLEKHLERKTMGKVEKMIFCKNI